MRRRLALFAIALGACAPSHGQSPDALVCNDLDAREVLAAIEARGADLSRPREAVFYFYGAESALPGMRRELERLGFSVRPTNTDPGLIASRTGVVDSAWLRRILPELCAAAARHEVNYDGWEASLPEQRAKS
jgi:regulator of ribonuclease activity B